ncbi:MAG: efflux RND transporter periplasmic adaptor subunit [Alphaproteobacteria bacterium]|nr:efflux RND transporter periplasmic adaptor subunit [Alphaproteobacteria bacterium]
MKKKWIVLGLIVALCGAGAYYHHNKKSITLKPTSFEMTAVAKGNIKQIVTATGTIQPINTISVGTQVSGIVEKVLADYNDEVKEGQLLAQLDTSVLVENRNDANARLELAKAKQRIAKLNYERIEKLYKDKLIAKASLEEAEIELATADANVLTAQADFNIAERNYGYAKITSPVSGTIISKEIEQGQTVAASLQTPTLFLVAEDLSKMQIEAYIAEADIGSIKSDMPVTFTVDSYPSDTFNGVVRQIRLSPTVVSNVVMYTVVIEVDNSSRKLLPGMTAFVSIVIEERDNVLRLPTSALQYKPNPFVKKFVDTIKVDLKPNEAMVYRFEKGRLVPTVFQKGLTDTSWVEVAGGLKEGTEIITEYIQGGGKRPR